MTRIFAGLVANRTDVWLVVGYEVWVLEDGWLRWFSLIVIVVRSYGIDFAL